MTLIRVPRPRRSSADPNRPANALLKAQIGHLQHAERRLPLRYRSTIYTHAIRTEGEAAEYIHSVTEAIHKAHQDAATRRAKRVRKHGKGLSLAAAAERPTRKRSKPKAKKSGAKRKRKKR